MESAIGGLRHSASKTRVNALTANPRPTALTPARAAVSLQQGQVNKRNNAEANSRGVIFYGAVDKERVTMKRYLLPFAAGIAVAVAGIAVAQDAGNGAMTGQSTMPQMTGDMPAPSDSPATRAFKEAKLKMMKAMQIAYTGNPDVDYVRGMMAHHQGAVDMAKVHLKFGKDPEMLKLSRDIVGSQEIQIAQMKEWLAKHAP